jgi:hypothetical protein
MLPALPSDKEKVGIFFRVAFLLHVYLAKQKTAEKKTKPVFGEKNRYSFAGFMNLYSLIIDL